MKFDFNRKYNTIALYVVLTVSICGFAIAAVLNFNSVVAFFLASGKVLAPIIYGFCIAYILTPVLRTSENLLMKITKNKIKQKPRRMIALFATYVFAIAILSIFLSIIVPQLMLSVTSLATLVSSWVVNVGPVVSSLFTESGLQELFGSNISSELTGGILSTITEMLRSFSNYLTTALPQLLQTTANIAGGVFNIIMGAIIGVYLLASKEMFLAQTRKLFFAMFPRKTTEYLIDIVQRSNKIFSGFITGKILDSCIVGVLCFFVMSIFNWPYAMLISVLVGVTNIIPYFGPFIGAIPSVLILLMVDLKTAIYFAIFVLILQQVDGNIIGPKILGDSTGLSPFWVVFSIIVFGSIMGPIGMFIGVPLFAVIYSVVKQLSNIALQRKGLPTSTKAYEVESALSDGASTLDPPKPTQRPKV